MQSNLKSSNVKTPANQGIALFLLRIIAAGALFYDHGLGKIINVVSGHLQFANPIGIGPGVSLILSAFAEGICTIFVAIGFYTRLASLVLVINFIVAFSFMFKELAFLYLLVFVVILLAGPGKWAIDSLNNQ